jgi:hypothetical protein
MHCKQNILITADAGNALHFLTCSLEIKETALQVLSFSSSAAPWLSLYTIHMAQDQKTMLATSHSSRTLSSKYLFAI